MRVPGDESSFYVNPFGLAFALMTAEDIITVSHEGEVTGGGRPGRRVVNKAGFLIHRCVSAGTDALPRDGRLLAQRRSEVPSSGAEYDEGMRWKGRVESFEGES